MRSMDKARELTFEGSHFRPLCNPTRQDDTTSGFSFRLADPRFGNRNYRILITRRIMHIRQNDRLPTRQRDVLVLLAKERGRGIQPFVLPCWYQRDASIPDLLCGRARRWEGQNIS